MQLESQKFAAILGFLSNGFAVVLKLYEVVSVGNLIVCFFTVILQNSHGNTALQDSSEHMRHIPTHILLAAGANVTHSTKCPLHDGATKGSVA